MQVPRIDIEFKCLRCGHLNVKQKAEQKARFLLGRSNSQSFPESPLDFKHLKVSEKGLQESEESESRLVSTAEPIKIEKVSEISSGKVQTDEE
jgi:hypothetical protein